MECWATGHWLTLGQAADQSTEILGGKRRTEEDIAKAGYLLYEGQKHHLRIYAIAREQITIRPVDPLVIPRNIAPDINWPDALIGRDVHLAMRVLFPGDVFEVNQMVLERLALLKKWKTADLYSAILRPCSFQPKEGWDKHNAWEKDGLDFWTTEYYGEIEPAIEIAWEDLRIDRADLIEFASAVGGSAGPSRPTATLPTKLDPTNASPENGLSNLFDGVGAAALEKMFATGSGTKWTALTERAGRNGLDKCRVGRGKFNPLLAAWWWLSSQNPPDWDWARCLRVLAKNLPPRSADDKNLLVGE